MIRGLRPYLLLSLLLHVAVFSLFGASSWLALGPGDGTREVRVSLRAGDQSRVRSENLSSVSSDVLTHEASRDGLRPVARSAPPSPPPGSGEAEPDDTARAAPVEAGRGRLQHDELPPAGELAADGWRSADGGSKDDPSPVAADKGAGGRKGEALAAASQGEGPAPAASPLAIARHRVYIRRALERLLAGYFHYPLMARRQGWEGRVVLRIDISADGEVGNIRVVQSSGHSVLDDSARQAMARAANAATLAAGPAVAGMEIPIIYRLRES